MLRALLARLLGRADDGPPANPDAETGADSEAETEEDPDAEPDPDDEDSGSVWDLIPGWQYDGRHVEAGGLTRGEQERALAEIQAQAEAIERGEEVAGDAEDLPDDG